jgi:hypothetical protein
MARVVLPKNERTIYLNFLIKEGLVEKHTYAGVKNKKLLFISEDSHDEVVITLTEIDFCELAYVYMDYIDNHVGYARCQKCNRIIKQSKTKPRKYCEECAKESHLESKRLSEQRRRDKIRGQNLTQQND